MDFSQIIKVIQDNLYVFIIMVIAVIVSIIYAVIRNKSMKKSNVAFLKAHPDAARVYLTNKTFITSEAVTVYTVDKEQPSRFTQKGKTGFYVAPGSSNVEMSYSYTRPGVMYKTVTTSTDIVEKILETKPNGSYALSFDRKAEVFVFEEFEV